MPYYVVVDGNNRWLNCGVYPGPTEAFADAQECEDFDPEVTVHVYEVLEKCLVFSSEVRAKINTTKRSKR